MTVAARQTLQAMQQHLEDSAKNLGIRIPPPRQPLTTTLASPDSLFGAIAIPVLQQFLKMKQDPQIATDFIRQHGLFRAADLFQPPDVPPSILAHWKKESETDERTPFALKVDDIWKEQDDLRKTIKILAMLRGDQESLARGLEAQLDAVRAGVALGSETIILSKLALVRPGLGFEGSAPVPYLLASDVLSSLYAFVWNTYVEKSPVRECDRCSAPFRSPKSSKRFCSRRCLDAAKAQHYREQQKTRVVKPRRKT